MGSRQIRAWQRFLLAALAVVLVALPSRAQTPLACGDILTNALDTIGQRHTYTYTATAGEVMSIRMVTLSGGLDSQLELRDGSSNLIATALNRIDRTLTNAGSYLIIAYDQGNNEIGSYSITMQKLNGGCASATALACGALVTNDVTLSGQLLAYTFAVATVPQTVSLRVESGTANFTPTLELYDALGRSLGTAATLTLTLTNTGTHTVLAGYSSGTSRTGAARLAFEQITSPCDTTALTCGTTVMASVDSAGELDLFTIAATAGDVVTLRLLGTNNTIFTPRFELYDAQGRIFNGAGGTTFTGTLTNGGTYTVLVNYSSGTSRTGNYWFAWEKLNGGCGAQAIACGDLLTNTLAAIHDFNAYTFTADAGGDFVTLRLDTGTTGFAPTMEMFDPLGRSLGSATAMLSLNLTNAGAHTLLVSYSSGASRTGIFHLSFERLKNPCQTVALLCGTTASGAILSESAIDVFTLASAGNEPVTLRLLSTNTTLFAPRFELYDAQGRVLNGVGGTTFTGTLTNAGNHTLLVYQNTGTSPTGNYWLAYERLNDACDGGALVCGDVATNTVTGIQEIHSYALNVGPGGAFATLRLESATANFTPTVELFDPLGRSLGSSTTAITSNLTNAGVHTVLVSYSSGTSRAGAYRLSYERIANPCLSTALVCGGVVGTTIALAGEIDVFTLASAGGEPVTLRLLSTNTTLFAPRFELYDAQGRALNGAGGTTFTGTLTNAGDHTLLVYQNTGTSPTGDYWLAYERLNDACDGGTLVCGDVATNTVTGIQEIHSYALNVGPGGAFATLRLESATANFVPTVELFDPLGRLVGSSTTTITSNLTNAGVHTVLVSYSSGTSRMGAYRLAYERVANPCLSTTLSCDGILATDIATPGEMDAVTFSSPGNDVVTFRLLSTNTTLFGPRFELFDPQGRALNGAGGTTFTGTLTNAGDYTLLVYQSTGTSQTGNYWLSAERLKAPCDSAMLACGTVSTNTISDLGELDLFTVAVVAPPVVTRFRLESVTANFTATMELYDPLGRSVGANASSITSTLTNAGTHTLLVSHNGSSSARTGGYRVIVEQIAPACSPLALACGNSVAGAISSAAEADVYAYAATAGEFVTFRLSGTNSTLFAPRLELFDPLGRSVAVSANTTFTGTLTNTGSYVLVVSYNTGSSRVGNYWLATERLVNPCAAPALGCGVLQTNTLGLGGLEVLTFAIVTNEAVTLRLASLTAGFTPGLELYDPTGRVVTAAGALTYSGTLSNAGNYTLVVRYASGTTREGNCTVYRQSLKTPCGALPLTCGELTDDWLEAGGLEAYFFSGATGDVVTLRFASTSFPAPTMEVFDPDGTSLTAGSFAVARTLTKTGNYLVLVQSGGTVPTIQDYQIVFQNLRAPCASVPLACGQVQAGRISANGEVQTYSFTAAPGERLRLQLGNNSQFFSAVLDLFDQAGALVTSGVTSWTGVSTNGGSYSVLVRWNANDNSRIGDYLLSYQRVPNPCGALPLTVGIRFRGTLEDPVEMNVFTFTGLPGPITLCFAMSSGNGQFELYSPTGAPLGSSGSQIQTNLPSSGVYTVLVRSTFGVGEYTLTLRNGFVSCATIDNTPPFVSINTPTANEFVPRGSNVLINWNTSDSSSIVRQEVRLSTDGGLTFPTQLADLPGNAFEFNWAVPAGPSVSGWRVRVLATDSGGNIGFGDTEMSTMLVNPGEVATNSFYYDQLDQLLGGAYDANTYFSFTYDSARNRTGVAVVEDPNVDSDNDGLPNGWESQYGLNPHNPADAALDLDGDGATNLQEFLAGTNPLSASSVFLVIDVARIDSSTISVTFLSILGRDYVLERTDDLGSGFWFPVDFLQAFGPVSMALDVNAFGLEQAFYRVRLN